MPKVIVEVSGHFTMFSRVLQNQMLQKCLVPCLSAMVLRMYSRKLRKSTLQGPYLWFVLSSEWRGAEAH